LVLEELKVKLADGSEVVGGRHVVDLEDLLPLLEGDAAEKRTQLVGMGYAKFFDRLRAEEGFEWL